MTIIYVKLVKAKKQFKPLLKSTQAFGYKYAQLEQVIDSIAEALWKEGLDFLQTIKDNKLSTFVVDIENGEQLLLTEVDLISVSVAKSNEMQAWGAGVTYAKRYSLMTAFGLATEDDDGKSATPVIKQPTSNLKIELADESVLFNLKSLYELKKEVVNKLWDVEKIKKLENALTISQIQKITALSLITELKTM
jgi:hypothetical protein